MEGSKLTLEDFWGKELTAIEVICEPEQKPTESQEQEITKITFGFGDKSMVVTPIADTDEIDVSLTSQLAMHSSKNCSASLLEHIGSKLGFTWNCANLKGYSDMYILGFEDLHPDILILCEASELLLFETARIKL
jgi:hypothetical protein